MATAEQINNFIDNLYLGAGNDAARVAAFAWTGLVTTELAVAAFDGDAELYGAFLARARLQTEAAAMESQLRVLNALNTSQQTTVAQQIAVVQAELAEKLAELDALGS